ncbi:DUF5995 family protein [Agriterribacter sp.]|uniref:DUF5995 family protein n=1 Tax=Agriterribacter sp. TaxID=2821509 RepID=UPI002C41897A|nr:DUF5995 family protein [Agriterribacter sp.]HRO48483.1 DUF5995 family protein [Agriterribacter sp.]HRQ18638.1 DUF5995 family protein [Agriterribacter sp.]
MQTIDAVIERLGAIVEQTKADQSRAGYFAALYKRMTMAVAKGIQQHAFEDADRMIRLDIAFAKRYLDAYDAYQEGNPCSTSWQFAFDGCRRNELIVIQHLLSGINTHINLDLAISAAEISEGTAIDDLEKDFNKINDIIASLIDDVQECLARVWLPMRLLEKIASGKHIPVINFSIDKARTASWSNALLLAGMNTGQKQFYIQQMDAAVLRLGQAIRSPGAFTQLILKGIRATEYSNISRIINLIDTTVVE